MFISASLELVVWRFWRGSVPTHKDQEFNPPNQTKPTRAYLAKDVGEPRRAQPVKEGKLCPAVAETRFICQQPGIKKKHLETPWLRFPELQEWDIRAVSPGAHVESPEDPK